MVATIVNFEIIYINCIYSLRVSITISFPHVPFALTFQLSFVHHYMYIHMKRRPQTINMHCQYRKVLN